MGCRIRCFDGCLSYAGSHFFAVTIHAGGLLGGYVGDAAAARWPDHGRISVVQFSVGIGVPLSAILFKVRGSFFFPGRDVSSKSTAHSCLTWS